jgi:cell division protein FtsL
MKKVLLIMMIGLLLVGCTTNAVVNEGGLEVNESINENNETIEENVETNDETDEDTTQEESNVEFEMIGEIIEIDGNDLHILSGDIVEIYTVNDESLKSLYIGMTVGLVSKGEHYEAFEIIQTETTYRYTTMGDMIIEATGEVIAVTEEILEIKTEDGTMVFDIYGPIMAQVGELVTVDYFQHFDELTFLEVYNETHKIETKVLKIEKSDNGELVVHLGEEEVAYIATLNGTVVNFSFSELKEGDMVDVYVEVMAMSYPAQMNPKKMTKK